MVAVEARVVAERAGEAEDQIVPRLVGEERAGALQKVTRITCLDGVHTESLDCIGNA